MVVQFLNGAPVWIWPLLILLIVLGFRASRTRTAPIFLFFLLPLLGVLSVRSVNALPAAQTVWVFFGIAYLVGAYGGYIFQGKRIISKSQGHVTLQGEWLTMAVLMLIFWMRFASGAIKAVSPETYASANFHMVFSIIAGLVAGTFIGRAVRLIMAPST